MNIHVVDSDLASNRMLADSLRGLDGVEVQSFYDQHSYVAFICSLKDADEMPGLIIMDAVLKEIEDNDFIARILRNVPSADIVLFTGQSDVETAFRLFRQGISNYVVKGNSGVGKMVDIAVQIQQKRKHHSHVRLTDVPDIDMLDSHPVLAGGSPAIRNVIKLILKAGGYVGTKVSLQGEEGTGKASVAKMIHFNSAAREKPFITVSLESMEPSHQDELLFGVEKEGSNYSLGQRRGNIERAAGGTLFIEEIALLDKIIQQKMLAMLKSGFYHRCRGIVDIPFNARIITSSTISLDKEVEAGRFSRELYYELRGIPVYLPSLRERREDIDFVADFYVARFNDDNPGAGKRLSMGARQRLGLYSYPGNIPELRSIVELACILAPEGVIGEEHIIFNSAYYFDQQNNILEEEMTLKQHTELIIRQTLEKYGNNVLKAAEILDIGKSTIYNFLKKSK
jgi:DNA-binding NtrC family response regulator